MQVEQSAIGGPARHLRFGVVWLYVLVGMFFLAGVMSRFERTTQIAPAQDDIQNACMVAAGTVALLSAAIGFWQLRERITRQRVAWAAILAMLGFGSSLFLFSEIAFFVEDWRDFPPGATRTVLETIPITYAYQHHGRYTNNWNIEVQDALLGIAPGDANFMLSHRLPGDTSGALDQIWSGGYFCARLTVQRAGNAKRIVHTGSNDLAPGSVVLCPKVHSPLAGKARK